MNRQTRFYAVAAGLVAAGCVVAWPFLTAPDRMALAWAGVLTLGVQLPLHALLRGWRQDAAKFVRAIGAGFAARAVAVLAGLVLFVIPARVSPAPFLLGLAAFLVSTSFAEALLESRSSRLARSGRLEGSADA